MAGKNKKSAAATPGNKTSTSRKQNSSDSSHPIPKKKNGAAGVSEAADPNPPPPPPVNRQRNLLVTECTHPFTLEFTGRYKIHHAITIQQTPDEDVWPGGALWDLGVVLAEVFVALALADTTSTTATTATATRTATGGEPTKGNKGHPKSSAVNVTLNTATTPEAPTSTGNNNKNNYDNKGKVPLKKSSGSRTIELPRRVLECVIDDHEHDLVSHHPSLILELGCGVGLTGLVASAAFRADLTVLTDLDVVVERVTRPNVLLNSTATPMGRGTPASTASTATPSACCRQHLRTIDKGQGKVIAMPLCWGNREDEESVAELLRELDTTATTPSNQTTRKSRSKTKKKGGVGDVRNTGKIQQARVPGMPDLVIIGDVAYQHRPGAPSHFDALLSTLLRFTDERTLVVFGTRTRMPASIDLLELYLRPHYDEVVVGPPLTADEVDPAFRDVKHNMTVHFFKKKEKVEKETTVQNSSDIEEEDVHN